MRFDYLVCIESIIFTSKDPYHLNIYLAYYLESQIFHKAPMQKSKHQIVFLPNELVLHMAVASHSIKSHLGKELLE